MKKIFALYCLLLLTACIDVDDYGDYWSKTSVDPSLQGRWVKLNEDDDSKLTSKSWEFKLKDGAYSVQSFSNGTPGDEDPLYPVKTLTIGKYKFIASGPERGTILRYEIVGDTAIWLVADPQKAWDFIEQKYPGQDSIYRDDPDPEQSAADNRDRPLRISHMDDNAANILASIPNNQMFWDPDTKTKKAQ